MKHLTLLTTVALLAGTPALAQSMADWDTDASGDLSRDEWNVGINSSTTFRDWDADASGAVDGQEFGGGLFDLYDADGDHMLTVTEWDDGFDRFYSEEGVDLDFSAWDTDGDEMIDREEFDQQFEDAGLYDHYRSTTDIVEASSEGITQEDFSDSMYDWMDRNRDEKLGADEDVWFQE